MDNLKQRISMIIWNYPKVQTLYGSILVKSYTKLKNNFILNQRLYIHVNTISKLKMFLTINLRPKFLVKSLTKLKATMVYYFKFNTHVVSKLSCRFHLLYTLKFKTMCKTVMDIKMAIVTYYTWEHYDGVKWEDIPLTTTNEEFVRHTYYS